MHMVDEAAALLKYCSDSHSNLAEQLKSAKEMEQLKDNIELELKSAKAAEKHLRENIWLVLCESGLPEDIEAAKKQGLV